jgi:amino acid adenylation domain-containing protein
MTAHTNPTVDGPTSAKSNLTVSQFRIWTGQMLNPKDPLYNMAMAFQISGNVSPSLFCTAFQKLIDQSDALRTVFDDNHGIPFQRIHEAMDYEVELIDYSASANPSETARLFMEDRAARLFTLGERLFDSALIKCGEDSYIWFLNQHHLICDAWSCAILFQRLAHYYQAAAQQGLGEVSSPPQFHSHRTLEKKFRDSPVGRDAIEFWKNKIGLPRPQLELYGHRSTADSTATCRISRDIGKSRSDRLRLLAGTAPFRSISSDLSLYYIFSTILYAYIHRISGQTDPVIGSPSHNRSSLDGRQTLGLFVELFPMQVTFSESETFRSLSDSVIAEVNSLFGHAQPGASQDIAGDSYSVVLNYLNVRFPDFCGLPTETYWIHSGFGDKGHALRLQVQDFNATGTFKLLFDFNHDVGPESLRENAVEHFMILLDAFMDNPDTRIDQVSLLSTTEYRVLIEDYNDTAAVVPAVHSIVELFKEQATGSAQSAAVSMGPDGLSYQELDRLSDNIAAYLVASGVEPEDVVAVYLDRSIELIASLLGIMKAGAAFLPIDSAFPRQRIAYVIEDSKASVVLTRDRLKSDLPGGNTQIVSYEEIRAQISTQRPDSFNLPTLSGSNLAYLIYTSGSTGRPKGVMIEHRSLLNYMHWARKEYMHDGPHDLPLFSSIGADLTITSIFLPLISGSSVVVYPESENGIDLSIIDVFNDDAVDIIKLTPSHLALLDSVQATPRRLKKLIVGGEDFKAGLARKVSALFGGDIVIYNEYGPTETTIGCMIYRFDPEQDHQPSVAIGKPIDNLRIYLLDSGMNPVPVGVPGDLYIGGAGLARGYHNHEALTAEQFVEDPFQPGERMYRSGDIGRWRSGETIDYLGREDDQVKVRGFRIERGEIEAAMGQLPGISEVYTQVIEHAAPTSEADIIHCLACGLPSNVPRADLDEHSICGPCRVFAQQSQIAEQFFKSEDELLHIFEQARNSSSGPYDCLMQYSGGKDSTFALYKLVEIGMRPLVFSFDNGYIPESAKENIRRIVADLNLDLVWGETEAINDILVESLRRFSNVCNGCQKVINTMSISLAVKHGISCIVTGLSRGQSFETRVADLLSNRVFDIDDMDRTVIEARKAYHQMDDAVSRNLDMRAFEDEDVFEKVQFIDFYRYCDVPLSEVLDFLKNKTPWTRPTDTGRSTNCLINEAGIYIHLKERGYHNYAAPYSWDVRLGHKQRDSALRELVDNIDESRVRRMLSKIGYDPDEKAFSMVDRRIVAYYVGERDYQPEELRTLLADSLPSYMIPAHFLRLSAFPLNATGKIDRPALPLPEESQHPRTVEYAAPRNETERLLATIWERVLRVERVGIHDNFFDLGGDSILNIQIVSRAVKAGLQITPTKLFQAQTIAALAQEGIRASQAQPAASSSHFSQKAYPLTPLQAGMLFHTLKEPNSGIYIEQYRCTLSGLVDQHIFQKAWASLVRQHPALRTSFIWHDPGQPRQVVNEEIDLDWQIKDIGSLSTDELSSLENRYLSEDRTKGFDLSQPPLLRFALFFLGAGSYRFIWTFHHIICDGWSSTQLIHELVDEYHAQSAGKTIFQSPERPFSDYVSWIHSQDLEKAELFWKEQLHCLKAPTPLPLRSITPGQQGHERLERVFSEDFTASLSAAAKTRRLTMNTIIQGAWAILLHRYTGEDDIIFGTTVSGRSPAVDGAESMVGCFINTLPIRMMVTPEQSFSEWLADLLVRQTEVRDYEYTSLIDLHAWSGLEPGVPLFNTIVVFENVPVKRAADNAEPSFQIDGIEYHEQSNFPISLIVLPGKALKLAVFYDRSFFSAEDISALLTHLHTLVKAFVENPEQSIESLPLLTPEELDLLARWRGTVAVPRPFEAVTHLFEDQARSRPHSPAVVCEAEKLTYSELNSRVNRLAHFLVDQKFSPGSRLGIYIDRSIDMVVSILAVLKSGSAYVPLDPGYPDQRISYMFADADPAAVITLNRLAGRLPECDKPILCLDDTALDLAASSDADPDSSVTSEDIAYVIYTSGSTGSPKGVMITQGNLSNSTTQRIRHYKTVSKRFLLLSSISFDSSIAGIFGTLCRGGCLYIPEQSRYQDISYLAGLINRHQISDILTIPSLYEHLLSFHGSQLGSLETVIVAGEACPRRLVESHLSTMTQTRLFNEYGPTEATVWSTVFDCSGSFSSATVPIGKPIENIYVHVLDKELRPLPPGVAGELYLGGPSISPGYLKRPELSAERFKNVLLPDNSRQRLYRTGDLVRFLDDGSLQFLGRNDQQIKLRGYRIELAEIESALGRIRAVDQAAVVPLGDSGRLQTIDENPEDLEADPISGLAAFITVHRGMEIESGEIKSSLAQSLPVYMIPQYIVALETLPLSPSGKVDRTRLPIPADLAGSERSAGAEPETRMERDIAEIWRRVLNQEQILLSDNFFDLGGHSLLAVQLFARIKKLTGLDLPLAILFKSPTLQDLANEIYLELDRHDPSLKEETDHHGSAEAGAKATSSVDRSNNDAWSVIVPIRKEGALPPLFLLHAIFGNILYYSAVLPHIDEEQPVYAIQAVGLDGLSRPFQDFQDMMTHYAARLREIQPHGPYLLGGLSLGGVLALELAHVLHQNGDDILFLGMFDSLVPPVFHRSKKLAGQMDETANQPVEQRHTRTKTISSKRRPLPHPGILARVPINWPDSRITSIFSHIVNLSFCRAYEVINKPKPHDLREWLMLYSHLTAIKSFRPKNYHVHISLFRSTSSRFDNRSDYGWGEYTDKGVDVIEVPVGHGKKFLESPVFGKALGTCLRRKLGITQ